MGTPWTLLLYGYTSNNAVSTLGGTSVLGKGHALGVRGIYQLPSIGALSHSVNFGIDYKHFDQDLSLGTTTLETPITYYPVAASYNLQYVDEESVATAGVTVTAGIRGAGSNTRTFQLNRAFAEADFVTLKADAAYTRELGSGLEGAARFAGQLADKPLVSSEQFSGGGWSSVRGYLQSEAVADDGVNGALELRSPSIASYIGLAAG